MDETKIELPAWLPWATTACLAALVACLGELWIIEKTRTQLLRDENFVAEASLKGAQNQLEAERIVTRREIEELRAWAGTNAVSEMALLLAPGADRRETLPAGSPWGVATWDTGSNIGSVRFVGLPKPGPDRGYRLWIDAPGPGYPQSYLVQMQQGHHGGTVASATIRSASPLPPAHQFLLESVENGEAATLDEAKAAGSIVLASPPQAGKISN